MRTEAMRNVFPGLLATLLMIPAAALAADARSPRDLCMAQAERTVAILRDEGKDRYGDGVASPGASITSGVANTHGLLYRQRYSRRLGVMPNERSCARLSDEPRPAATRSGGALKVTRGGAMRTGP